MMRCLRCNYEWKPMKKEPKQCPNCKNYYYNKPREWKKVFEAKQYIDEQKTSEPTEQTKPIKEIKFE